MIGGREVDYDTWRDSAAHRGGSPALFLLITVQGNSRLVVRLADRTPFAVDARTEKSLTVSSVVAFENTGRQHGTIVDCLVRPQLPFEQYDGIEARAKAERADTPREDDYFEASLVSPGKTLEIRLVVTLTARRGLTIEEALSRMVDLPLDIIYTELSRRPWRLRKVRLVLTAEEIAKLAGVTRRYE